MTSRKAVHRLYVTWKSMRSRCKDPSNKSFARYGGKGVRVCDEWRDFGVFVADMGPSFSEGLTLDRKDNGKG